MAVLPNQPITNSFHFWHGNIIYLTHHLALSTFAQLLGTTLPVSSFLNGFLLLILLHCVLYTQESYWEIFYSIDKQGKFNMFQWIIPLKRSLVSHKITHGGPCGKSWPFCHTCSPFDPPHTPLLPTLLLLHVKIMIQREWFCLKRKSQMFLLCQYW